MQGNEIRMAEAGKKPLQIASWRHLTGFFLITLGMVALGIHAQHAHPAGVAPGQLGSHGAAIQVYLVALAMDWALFYYCWAGVHRRGSSLWSLAGGRWTSWKSVAVDLAIALPFWIVWEGAAWAVHELLGPGSAKAVDSLLPKSLPEVLIWIAVAITAGICEEMVFRGYLQRQFHALTGNVGAAVIAQGAVFGLFHAYQGWRNVTVIAVLGILYGIMAAVRGNLRVNIVAHAWTDIWEGWFKFVVWH